MATTKPTKKLAKLQELAIQGFREGRFTREAVRAMLISSGMKINEVERNLATFGGWL